MSIRRFFESSRARRGLAASVVVLCFGGLVLVRAPGSVAFPLPQPMEDFDASGSEFRGSGATGRFALTHSKVLAGEPERVFAELRIKADDGDRGRAPLALAVVLDTSGSMIGAKLDDAKRSVEQLLRRMDDDDEIALVRYDVDAELIQPLARVGDVRQRLLIAIAELEAGGGTNIPAGMRKGAAALQHASGGRIQRLLLVSDGLDDERGSAESIARRSAATGVTVSSVGIGLDFDEGYMSSVARLGHGNFVFAQQARALRGFLQQELKQTAGTVVTDAHARLRLPRGVRFVRAVGAEARADGRNVDLALGALHRGDMRRVVVELTVEADEIGDTLGVDARIKWRTLDGDTVKKRVDDLEIVASGDPAAVMASRDARVWARAISAMSSLRQLDAVQAFGRGDASGARRIIDDNVASLEGVLRAAPESEAPAIARQIAEYKSTRRELSADGDEARTAAKAAAEKDSANLARPSF